MRTKTVVGGVFFVLASVALLAGILLYSPLAPAAPSVKWTPSAVVQEVAAGETVTTTASFTASTTLSDVIVRVVPELAPYVAVDPLAYGSVSKGGTYELTLTISAPVDAQIGTYDGTIQLRSGSGSTTYAKPLPVELEVVWPTYDGSADLGITIDYPAEWYVASTDTSAVFRNVAEPAPFSEWKLETESFFRIYRLRGVNPDSVPIADWFTAFAAGGFPTAITSQDSLVVGGRDAVRIVLPELGGERVHICIGDNTDVIEVSYGLFALQFIADYEAMVQTLDFSE